MNNFPKFLILFFSLCWNFLANAQISISSSQLAGTRWTLKGDNKVIKDTVEYTSTKEVLKDYLPTFKKTIVHKREYYLSETTDTIFDKTKVGKQTYGCYLITYNEKNQECSYFKIIKFNLQEEEFILYRPSRYDMDSNSGNLIYKLIQ